jgi:3alpha(or 20beta)-hydroxysteroid dehydrogenase
VNSAGIYSRNSLVDLDLTLMRRLIDVHLVGTLLGMHAVIDAMRDGGGSIVNISSGAGIRGLASNTAYTAAKFGVRGATHAAALELAPMGIRVNSVHPGPVDTTLLHEGAREAGWAEQHVPLGRLAQPRDIATMVAFLASPESSYCTGAEFIVDGGISA